MAVEIRTVGPVRVLVFTKKVTRGTGDVEMREQFRQQLGDGAKDFLFDFRDVTFFDSAAVGEMVACLKRVGQNDGKLKLLMVRGSRPFELIKLAALDRVFEIYDDERRVLDSFSD